MQAYLALRALTTALVFRTGSRSSLEGRLDARRYRSRGQLAALIVGHSTASPPDGGSPPRFSVVKGLPYVFTELEELGAYASMAQFGSVPWSPRAPARRIAAWPGPNTVVQFSN
jgi:hypothetical protein